jgi:NADP-dependent 3-hydroxy acid dehydrogenase YdfG
MPQCSVEAAICVLRSAMNQPSRVRPLALVTGIGSCLARALARALAERQLDLLLVDPDGDRLLELREQLGSVMVHVQLFQCDVAVPAQRRELLSFLTLAGAKPDLAVFLPEGGWRDERLSAPAAAARRLQESVLGSVDDLLRGGVLASMLAEGNGYLLLLTDDDAFRPDHPAWRAGLHHGLEQYGLQLGREVGPAGVQVTVARVPGAALVREWEEARPNHGELARRLLAALFARKARFGIAGKAPLWWRGRT